MAHLFFRSIVAEYDAWRSVFDSKSEFRASHGVQSEDVFQEADNANSVTTILEFESVAAAQAFAALPELRENMAEAGVIGPPTVWFTERR